MRDGDLHKNAAPQILRPGPDRAEEIAELAHRTFSDTFVGKAYYTHEIIDGYAAKSLTPEIFASHLADPKHQLFLVTVDGRTAGFAHVAEREPAECVKDRHALYLNRLYLDKAFHRQGLGSILMEQCFAEARQRGYEWMWLSVWEHNFAAQAFYERMGFRPHGEWEWPFESNGVRYVDRDLIYAIQVPATGVSS
jgi:ribosomal protein S18 acetylase RimI-like enzyme